MMPPVLHYPDLALPPPGWTPVRIGTQIRLRPPATAEAHDDAAIIVSPLLARHKGLPPIEQLIAMAIEAEVQTRFYLIERAGPSPITATTGLVGCYYEVRGHARPAAPVERRIYVMYADQLCNYGINYVAGDKTHEKYLKLFWDVARSVKPFAGRVVTQQTLNSGSGRGSGGGSSGEAAPHDPYRD